MTTEAILEAVADAARSRHTLAVSLRTDAGDAEAEVEPYSIVRRRVEPTFYCWDVGRRSVVGLPLAEVLSVKPTQHRFAPRYDVEF